jgi:hypothetical protein
LDVFDQRDFEETVWCKILNDGGDRGQSGEFGGTESAFAGDEFEAVIPAAKNKRLYYSIFPDRLGELFEFRVIEDVTGLVGARLDFVYRDLKDGVLVGWGGRRRSWRERGSRLLSRGQQGGDPFAKSSFLVRGSHAVGWLLTVGFRGFP